MYYLFIYFLLGWTMSAAIDRANYHLRRAEGRCRASPAQQCQTLGTRPKRAVAMPVQPSCGC